MSAKRSPSLAELAIPAPQRLRRELAMLAATPNDGPKFAVITSAIASAVTEAFPAAAAEPTMRIVDLIRVAAESYEAAIGAIDWTSAMEQAGNLEALEAARVAFYVDIKQVDASARSSVRNPPRHLGPPPTTGRDHVLRAIDAMLMLRPRILSLPPLFRRRAQLHARDVAPYDRWQQAHFLLRDVRARADVEQLPLDAWDHIVAQMSPATARAFARCSHWAYELVSRRWKRLFISGASLQRAAPELVLSSTRFSHVKRVCLDLADQPAPPAAAAWLADVLRACGHTTDGEQRKLTLRLTVNDPLDFNAGTWARAAVPKISLRVIRRKPVGRLLAPRDICARLSTIVDFGVPVADGGFRELCLRGNFDACLAPTLLLTQPTLRTISIDAPCLKVLATMSYPQLRRLPQLRLRDRDSLMVSPFPVNEMAAMFAPQQLWCETVLDAVVLVDALAHANQLCITDTDADGVSTGPVLSRIYHGRRAADRRQVQCASQLDIAQTEYFLYGCDNEDNIEENTHWFKTHFPAVIADLAKDQHSADIDEPELVSFDDPMFS